MKLIHYYGFIAFMFYMHPTQAQKRIDPTKPPHFSSLMATEVEEQKDTSLRLNMVRSKGTTRTAMINGKMFSKGDEVGNAKIINITKNTVELLQEGESVVLTMNIRSIKMPSKTERR